MALKHNYRQVLSLETMRPGAFCSLAIIDPNDPTWCGIETFPSISTLSFQHGKSIFNLVPISSCHEAVFADKPEIKMLFGQDDIRTHLGSLSSVVVQIADREDGSPEIAWGDTFFYLRNANGEPGKMPFTTIVIKDYDGFDCDSKLNRGGLFRLNIEVGKEKFAEVFGFAPKEFEANRKQFDFASIDTLFPHPVYGAYGWISIINPGDASATLIKSLLNFAHERSQNRISVEPLQS